jgi:hypothetical protein
LSEQGAGQNAYLWTSGYSLLSTSNLRDYATITQIDDVKIPNVYLPRSGDPPGSSSLLEIPAGQHVIEILYKEDILLCHYGGCFAVEKTQQTLTFTAEPNRTYAPFVADKCSKQYFWIENLGPYVVGSETQRVISDIKTELTKPVVAGEAPNKDSCE